MINPNKPDTTVTPTPTNGLIIDGTSGKVTGTPTGLTWNGDDTEQTVNIPVVITKGNETVNETIPVVVQRLSRNGQPETQDSIPEYTEPIGTTGVDGNGNLIDPPVVDIPEYTKAIGTTGVDENGNLINPPVVDIPEYIEPIGTTGVDGNGNLINPPVVDIPEYTEPIGTTGVDENGNLINPPVVDVPEYTESIGTTGVDENGNLINPPVVDIPEYTESIGTTGVDENGNLLAPPVVDIPEYTEPIGTTGVDENGNLLDPPVVERPEFNGGVNGELPDPVELPKPISTLPEVNGNIKQTPTGKVEKSTKRLANTGEAETNTGLAELGLAVLGSLLAVAKRRREDEE